MENETCEYFKDGQCTRIAEEEDLKLELRYLASEIQLLKDLIVKMCYEKYGE